MDHTNTTYVVPAVEKAILILEYLTNSSEGRRLRDLNKELGIPKTTAFSIMNTLVHSGLAKKNTDGLYLPTLKLTAMGIQAKELTNKSHSFRPQLEELRDLTGFTVFYSIYDNGEQIILEKLDGLSSVVFKSYIGERKRITTSANGKAMAAYLSPQDLQAVLEKGFAKLTTNSICSEHVFLEQLELIRKQGYAIDDGEGELGVRCIGVPVFMYLDRVYGAISISALSDGLPFTEIPKYAKLLREVAADMSKNLGYTGAVY